jgi:hypothetical protein
MERVAQRESGAEAEARAEPETSAEPQRERDPMAPPFVGILVQESGAGKRLN